LRANPAKIVWRSSGAAQRAIMFGLWTADVGSGLDIVVIGQEVTDRYTEMTRLNKSNIGQ
jgi:hypothetical protein